MKALLCFALLLSLAAASAREAKLNKLTIQGIEYKNPVIKLVSSSEATVRHEGGTFRIEARKLPGIVHGMIGYDAKTDADERAAREESAAKIAAAVALVKNRPLDVKSKALKHVDGSYRYFFEVSNRSKRPWKGDVKIQLLNPTTGPRPGASEVFSTTEPMAPRRWQHVFMDVPIGPPSVHGDYGIIGFTYEISVDGKIVGKGEGVIADKIIR